MSGAPSTRAQRAGKRELTEREMSIVQLVVDFRILSGAQIQQLVFPTGTLIGARRRTQSTLRRLVLEQYLHRLERRVGGERAGSASYCYLLGPAGQRLLDPVTRARRPAEPGLAFVAHHLAVAEVYVGLVDAERDGLLEVLERQTEPSCWRVVPKAFGGSEQLKPDLFVALGVGDLELRWFIEVDLGTESIRRVERTCGRYVAYYRTGVEQAAHEVFPKVVWLTNSQRRATAIRDAISRLPDEERQLFTVGFISDSNYILKGGEA